MRDRKSQQAFTLMEMMVVVSIMSLLISIMLPALSEGRRAARATQCRSNLHQQGIALIGYVDQSNFYPGAHTSSHNGPNSWIVWAPRIRQYIQDRNTDWFSCPDGPPHAKWEVKMGSGLPAKYGYRQDEVRLEWFTPFSYGYNNWGTRDFSIPQYGLGGLTEHPHWGELPGYRVIQPSNMIAMGDSQVDGVWDAFIDTDQPSEYPDFRHPGHTANIVYCDGHVDSMKFEEVLSPDWLRRWNVDFQFH